MHSHFLSKSCLIIAFSTFSSEVGAQVVGSAAAKKAIRDYGNKNSEMMAEVDRDHANGEKLFGSDKRWKDRGYSGTLADKRPSDFKVDDWGKINDSFRVIQKVSDTECLVISKVKNSPTMLLRGLNMSKVTDKAEFVLHHPVVIQTTYSYTAVNGANKTILVLEVNNAAIDKLATPEVVSPDAIEAVKKEIEQIKTAMAADEERLKKANTAKVKQNLQNWIKKYKDRLAVEEKKLKELEEKVGAKK